MADWRTSVSRLWVMGAGQPAFDFDSVLSERHISTLEVTDNPVETGVVISDHAFMRPRAIEVYAVVSDVWLRMRQDAQGTDLGAPNKDKDWLVSKGDSASRSQRAFNLLLNLQASAVPFTLQTGLATYSNVLCLELEANQDKDTASALVFRALLREIQIVGTLTVVYPPRAAGKTTTDAAKKTTGGEKQAIPPTPAKAKSLLLQGAQATGVL